MIALNWAGDRPHFRYPDPAEDNARHFAAEVKAALVQSVEQLGATIMFLPHLRHVDSDMYAEFADGFPAGSVFGVHEALPFLYPPPGEMLYPHVPFFTNLYRQADLVIGMRFHACVLAFGAGTRFMRLGSHPKLQYFVEDLGVTDHAIPLVDRQADTATSIAAGVRACLRDDGYANDLDRALGRQVGLLRAFNERVLDLVK